MKLLILILFITIAYALVSRWITKAEIKAAGKNGEIIASSRIRSVLSPDDILLTNVEVSFEGKDAEFDNLIINRYGVFIIEVKSYNGRLVGGENDYEWKKYHTTAAGNTYEKSVKNPIRQVKRQTYILSEYLKSKGLRVWVEGYAYLLDNNSPVRSETMLQNFDDIYHKTHTAARQQLSRDTIQQICQLLSK